MALADRNSDERHKITDNTKLTRMSASFAEAKHLELEAFPMERGMLYQIQGMQDDIKEIHRYLRAEVGDGAKGDTGDTGPQGATGPQGPAGNNGSNGSNGSNGAAGAAGNDAGVYDDRGTDKVFLPASAFVGGDYTSLTAPDGTTTSNRAGSLIAMWPGISGKSVTHIQVETNSASAIGSSVNVYRTQLSTTTALLARAGNSDTALDITDWTCALGESLAITIAPGATTIKVEGAILTLR